METRSVLKQYIVSDIMHGLDQNVLDDESVLIEGGIIDSMNLIKLVAFIEEKFSITVDDEDLDIENFRTINALTDFVNKKIQ